MKLYHNPVSAYSQKVLMAFYEKGLGFTDEVVNLFNPVARERYQQVYPRGKIPMLVLDDGEMVPESSIIIETIDAIAPQEPRLIPADPDTARSVRLMDRNLDLYLTDPVTSLLFETMQPHDDQNQTKISQWQDIITLTYTDMAARLEDTAYIASDNFSMADCAAIAGLFYAQETMPFAAFPAIVDYWQRLKERASYHRLKTVRDPLVAEFRNKGRLDD